jgi:hypothetical protein
MPVLRYFLYVGGALLTLLLAVNALVPQAPATGSTVSSAETPVIRIHSDRKWPERVVFDTSQRTIAPAPVTVAKADDPVAATAVTVASPKARVREAFAQLPLSEQLPPVAPADTPKAPPKRKVVKARPAQQPQPMMLVAQHPHSGLFGNTW